MPPTPLLPHSIDLALQYITPPGQPLPPHLVSKSLLQRHHFLHISPHDPQQYLCWPSSDRTRTVELLDAFIKPIHDETYGEYPVRYMADDEHAYAIVCLSTEGEVGLRITFQWDEVDGWKYHDSNTMPFPPGSLKSLADALSVSSYADTSASDGFDVESPSEPADIDEDDYWNAYGGPEEDHEPPKPVSISQKDEGSAEDAYWAQYASIQGSADSTRPSPLPRRRKSLQRMTNDPDSEPTPTEVPHGPSYAPIEFAYETLHPRTKASPTDPVSPDSLSRRLTSISPRRSSPTLASTAVSAEDVATEAPVLLKPVGEDAAGPSASLIFSNGVREAPLQPDGADDALRESVRAIYRLWRAGKRRSAGATHGVGAARDAHDRQLFQSIVEDVIRDS